MENLQRRLADLKTEYLSQPSNRDRDNVFADREAAIVEQFHAIGHHPSYPVGFLESLFAHLKAEV